MKKLASFSLNPIFGTEFCVMGCLCGFVVLSYPLSQLWKNGWHWSLTDVIGVMAILTVIGLHIIFTIVKARNLTQCLAGKTTLDQVLVLMSLLCVMVAVWCFHNAVLPLLMCIIAAMGFWAFSFVQLVALLLFANTVLIALYLLAGVGWSVENVVILIAGYMVCQAFTILMFQNVVDATKARSEMMRINRELLATRQLLKESIRAEERLRLSRDLHDVAGHKLTALKLQLSLVSAEEAAYRQTLKECGQLADELLQDIRHVVSTLRQNDGINLHTALRALDLGFKSPVLHFELDSQVRMNDISQANTLLHCAQEGLTNALRHSAAKNIWIKLMTIDNGVHLFVEDDGRGIHQLSQFGNGLIGLSERMAEIGGQLTVQARYPVGTILAAKLFTK
ncbi:histidine kinase [Acinetobacter sp. Ac_5812]|uniref:sensor histidine kinase n=1 Tax=Acinetobacter sp. Ac_5812 TaxID=1848937 RepID=UPI00148F476D|nr:histidine kinase [Acinetobacter sp. Ac_5812]NNP67966.1 hypothetical protein [Acinetobacter sp. Ac_5812]